jgi:hypothetical protein
MKATKWTMASDLDLLLDLQREYADEFARTGSRLSMLGIADCVMEEALIRLEPAAEAKA